MSVALSLIVSDLKKGGKREYEMLVIRFTFCIQLEPQLHYKSIINTYEYGKSWPKQWYRNINRETDKLFVIQINKKRTNSFYKTIA